MNIFYLDEDIENCAKSHMDKHVIKMPTEYVQMLSTAHRVLDGSQKIIKTKTGRARTIYEHHDPTMNDVLWKSNHVKHPCSVWVRKSTENYDYLYRLAELVLKEYQSRYGKYHKTENQLMMVRYFPNNLPTGNFTEPPAAMGKWYDQCFVSNDIIESYRNYYRIAKRDIATWKQNKPDWFDK